MNGAPLGDLEQPRALLVAEIPIELKVPFNAVKASLLLSHTRRNPLHGFLNVEVVRSPPSKAILCGVHTARSSWTHMSPTPPGAGHMVWGLIRAADGGRLVGGEAVRTHFDVLGKPGAEATNDHRAIDNRFTFDSS